jgi:hypothetical protein
MIPHLTAALVSAAVILSAPFMGQIRALLRSAFPGHFAAVVAGSVTIAVLGAVGTALFRVRSDRARRYAAILGAVVVGAGYSVATASGVPDVDAVERVHFVEYGVITWLFYRAWRPAGGLTILLLPIAAGLIVGTLEEWFQWFIPNRIGEARDVLLNLVAIGCGLAFSIGLSVPAGFAWQLRQGSAMRVGVAGGAAILVFALFLHVVHLGHEITDPDAGRFKSRYTVAELEGLARDRMERWRAHPPTGLVRLSREDQFMDEGLWHVRRRNEAWTANDYAAAWSENRILEKFFAPVLDTPSYVAPQGTRWPELQRADAERKRMTPLAQYVSRAEPYPLFLWPRGLFWSITSTLVIALVSGGIAYDRRRTAAAQPLAV